MGRLRWDDIPPEVHREIEQEVGASIVRADDQAPLGTAEFSAAVHTNDGSWFVKVVPKDEHVHSPSRANEPRLNRLLPRTAPKLLWRRTNGDWVVTGYEYVYGWNASLAPGSADIPALIQLLTQLAVPVAPGAEQFPSLGAQWSKLSPWRTLAHNKPRSLGPWERAHLKDFVDLEQYIFDVLFGGTCITHADVSESNVLIGQSGMRIVGWTWATRAPAWADAAVLAVRMVGAGHSPQQAEGWMGNIPAWENASTEALDAFSVALLGLWTATSRYPKLVDAARRYATYRLAANATHQ